MTHYTVRYFKGDYRIARNGNYSRVKFGDPVKIVSETGNIVHIELESKMRVSIDKNWMRLCTSEFGFEKAY